MTPKIFYLIPGIHAICPVPLHTCPVGCLTGRASLRHAAAMQMCWVLTSAADAWSHRVQRKQAYLIISTEINWRTDEDKTTTYLTARVIGEIHENLFNMRIAVNLLLQIQKILAGSAIREVVWVTWKYINHFPVIWVVLNLFFWWQSSFSRHWGG